MRNLPFWSGCPFDQNMSINEMLGCSGYFTLIQLVDLISREILVIIHLKREFKLGFILGMS